MIGGCLPPQAALAREACVFARHLFGQARGLHAPYFTPVPVSSTTANRAALDWTRCERALARKKSGYASVRLDDTDTSADPRIRPRGDPRLASCGKLSSGFRVGLPAAEPWLDGMIAPGAAAGGGRARRFVIALGWCRPTGAPNRARPPSWSQTLRRGARERKTRLWAGLARFSRRIRLGSPWSPGSAASPRCAADRRFAPPSPGNHPRTRLKPHSSIGSFKARATAI